MSRIKARRHLIEITAALKVPCWVRSISVIKVVVAIPNKIPFVEEWTFLNTIT